MANFLLSEFDECWKKTLQKERRKSESDVNVSENPSDFGFAKKLWDSDNVWIQNWTLNIPSISQLLEVCCMLLLPCPSSSSGRGRGRRGRAVVAVVVGVVVAVAVVAVVLY